MSDFAPAPSQRMKLPAVTSLQTAVRRPLHVHSISTQGCPHSISASTTSSSPPPATARPPQQAKREQPFSERKLYLSSGPRPSRLTRPFLFSTAALQPSNAIHVSAMLGNINQPHSAFPKISHSHKYVNAYMLRSISGNMAVLT